MEFVFVTKSYTYGSEQNLADVVESTHSISGSKS